MGPDPQFLADLVIFTETFIEKFISCAVYGQIPTKKKMKQEGFLLNLLNIF